MPSTLPNLFGRMRAVRRLLQTALHGIGRVGEPARDDLADDLGRERQPEVGRDARDLLEPCLH